MSPIGGGSPAGSNAVANLMDYLSQGGEVGASQASDAVSASMVSQLLSASLVDTVQVSAQARAMLAKHSG